MVHNPQFHAHWAQPIEPFEHFFEVIRHKILSTNGIYAKAIQKVFASCAKAIVKWVEVGSGWDDAEKPKWLHNRKSAKTSSAGNAKRNNFFQNIVFFGAIWCTRSKTPGGILSRKLSNLVPESRFSSLKCSPIHEYPKPRQNWEGDKKTCAAVRLSRRDSRQPQICTLLLPAPGHNIGR